jgi:hypothetical protein
VDHCVMHEKELQRLIDAESLLRFLVKTLILRQAKSRLSANIKAYTVSVIP